MDEGLLKKLQRLKWPVLILILGIILMLLPTKSQSAGECTTEDARLAAILSSSRGIGETQVLISDNGVIVSCEGADRAEVRLRITEAVGAYTGFKADRVTILVLEK